MLASLAVATYSLLRAEADAPGVLLGRIWRYEHVDEMVQVFLEDLTIAILFVRLAAALGSGWATVIVAVLFAAGHIPTMVSQGATWLELGGLLGDVGLGVAVILVLQRSRDVVWFWCIHFCLDMTQFARVSGVG
ncbi:MAG TPA: CPBP family glutamic-type intramembrane protease [Longimicrobiales bacterium]|nr:CPBP family glutamic-type intramembrane protease [Longimicrobiales bacterium]